MLISFASFFVAGLLPPAMLNWGASKNAAKGVNLLFRGIYAFGTIIAVCKIMKTLHDPLTPQEAEELKKKESLEKTGVEE